MNTQKTIMTILIFLFFSSLGLLIYYKIFYPSYLSVQNSCAVFDEEDLSDKGFEIAGLTIFNITKDGEEEITLRLISQSDKTLRHEICHIKQIQQGRIDGCERRFYKLWDEMECYFLENLPVFNDEIAEYRRILDADNQTGN